MPSKKTKTRAYRAWANMKQRCNNPNSSNWKWYGARGIKVCELWRDSFGQFLADMGDPPSGLQLDRINSDGNYEPENCRWADANTQSQNRGCVRLTWGDVKTIRAMEGSCREIGEQFGIHFTHVSMIKLGKIWKSYLSNTVEAS